MILLILIARLAPYTVTVYGQALTMLLLPPDKIFKSKS